MTNYEWLLQMGGEERQIWFDAPHVDDNDALTRKSDVRADDACANDANAAQDSREKLEDDIQSDLAALSEYGKLMLDWYVVMDWLDRQAAIDRKEFETILEGIQECMRNGSR